MIDRQNIRLVDGDIAQLDVKYSSIDQSNARRSDDFELESKRYDGREAFQTLRHIRHAAGLHTGCNARSWRCIRPGRLRTRDGRAARARSRLLERRGQADRQSCLPATPEIRLRRLSADSLRQLRSAGHHQGRPGRAGTQARRRRRDHPRPHAVLRRIRRTSRRPRMALLRRSQHRRRGSDWMLLPGQGVRAHQVDRQADAIRVGEKSMPWSTPTSAKPPCATTRRRICFMPDCAKCWASM